MAATRKSYTEGPKEKLIEWMAADLMGAKDKEIDRQERVIEMLEGKVRNLRRGDPE